MHTSIFTFHFSSISLRDGLTIPSTDWMALDDLVALRPAQLVSTIVHSSSLSLCSMIRSCLSKRSRCPMSTLISTNSQPDLTQPRHQPSALRSSVDLLGTTVLSKALVTHSLATQRIHHVSLLPIASEHVVHMDFRGLVSIFFGCFAAILLLP